MKRTITTTYAETLQLWRTPFFALLFYFVICCRYFNRFGHQELYKITNYFVLKVRVLSHYPWKIKSFIKKYFK